MVRHRQLAQSVTPSVAWVVTVRIVPAVVLVGALIACDGAADGDILVSAAASLTDAFADIELAFEAANPGVDVVLNLGGSSALRAQILDGAPVDVFASADKSNMDQIVSAGETVGEPWTFAENHLHIAVPPGNPAGVVGLEDFANEELLIGLCAEGVPCGDLAREALDNAGVAPSIDSNEPGVRALLTKVEAGELDAAIVYATDVAAAAGAVDGVEISDTFNVRAEYTIAVIAGSAGEEAATAFIDFVLSEAGRQIMIEHGFTLP
jgi:molybdate transport system substrate-binding protein